MECHKAPFKYKWQLMKTVVSMRTNAENTKMRSRNLCRKILVLDGIKDVDFWLPRVVDTVVTQCSYNFLQLKFVFFSSDEIFALVVLPSD